jgi:hypothetical protein
VTPTAEQASELRALVPYVCQLVGEADADAALALALADPAAGLTCYRALVAELALPAAPQSPDDRRPCTACANFSAEGRCLAAWRGARIANAGREYHPACPDLPRRCEGYVPGPDDEDRRPGAERWPRLCETRV